MTRARTNPSAVLLPLLAMVAVVSWWNGAANRDDDRTAGLSVVSLRLDPNVATAPDLSLLPGIGPSKARDIVAFRQTKEKSRGAAGTDGRVFQQPADLDAVKGIGPKTVARMAHFLIFPNDAHGGTE